MNIDLPQLDRLISLAKSTGIHALEIEQGNERIKITCQPANVQTSFQPQNQNQIQPAVANVLAPTETVSENLNTVHQNHKITVTAPMLGTFYRKSSPDAAEFVQAGDAVKAGDTLCIIEAMKMMYEVKAEHDGVIGEILATEGEMVQFGADLMTIDVI